MEKAFVVVGLGFGDEGKGSITDFLCREYQAHTVVRFNGGAQAGHNVVLPDGTHHTFSQFGAGTLAGAQTFLSQHMVINPHFLESERKHLVEIEVTKPAHLLKIDSRALVTTPFHVAANRLSEMRRTKRHGSCGMGVGETVADSLESSMSAIRVNDFANRSLLARKLRHVQKLKADRFAFNKAASVEEGVELDILHDPHEVEHCLDEVYENFLHTYEIVPPTYMKHLLSLNKPLVFEGAQGALLDENHGFNPYTTWSTTTADNALTLLDGHPSRVIGVTRAYHTRHGAGPFPTEEPSLSFPDHNRTGPWQGAFRFGSLDLVLLKYARYFAGCTELAVTCLDHLPVEEKRDLRLRIGTTYDERINDLSWEERLWNIPRDPEDPSLAQLVESCKPLYSYVNERREVPDLISKALQLPVTLISEGPTYKDKRCP